MAYTEHTHPYTQAHTPKYKAACTHSPILLLLKWLKIHSYSMLSMQFLEMSLIFWWCYVVYRQLVDE